MGVNLVHLNVNPCKMCMPMGAVSAFYGIRNCMTILHGSQGCSTYIRRHMATHYNEPVDIASSSLTEQGTVFGGAQNLIRGLENMIALYHPEVIGVATSCLAETIGEDVPAILREFSDRHPEETVKLIPVASAGYSGTQYEGFFRALRAVTEHVEMDTRPNGKINLVTGLLTPADTRALKRLLRSMGVAFILLPDLSENLDGVHREEYDPLPGGGTPLSEIARMGGAAATIELTRFISSEASPAEYLSDRYGVPYVRLAPPVGLRDTDAFLAELVRLGARIPQELRTERGRYLDAMIDSHKYNAEGRAAVFGEPDFVRSAVRLCCENGIVPVAAATGSVCRALREDLLPQIRRAAQGQFAERYDVLDDADFDAIERCARENGANLMIGNSDGRRAAEKLGLPLVRCSFPVHDRIGGQRLRMLGYDGSLSLLDRITNALLAEKNGRFRAEQYRKYYREGDSAQEEESPSEKNPASAAGPAFPAASAPAAPDLPAAPALSAAETAKKTETHPCFRCGEGKYARIHLPVAPKCNIQCNYCVRKYDCPNESRPGVTTEILTPEQAFEKYRLVKSRMKNLTVAGIAGPGDSLANFEETKRTLELIRAYDPGVTFCLSTNGLMLPFYAEELLRLGVTHVTVTVNAVDPKIGARIYAHVRYLGQTYTGEAAAGLLLANQLAGIRYLTSHGAVCKVNTVVLRGINEAHIEDVVKRAKELGCDITNIMQLIPVQGSAFEAMPLVSNREIMKLRGRCESILPQMYHCRQCRADAVGTLDNDLSIEYRGCTHAAAPEGKRLMKRFAVATKSGILVDQHFGHAEEFYIYESDGVRVNFLERRKVPSYCAGGQECGEADDKMERILGAVSGCSGVLALRIGHAPSQRLSEKGIRVFTTYERIEDAVRAAAAADAEPERGFSACK